MTIMQIIIGLCVVIIALVLIFGGHKSLRRYSLKDLQSRRVEIDLNELHRRAYIDERDPRDVCQVKRTNGPTPCWWPFCDCSK
jgi:hypothetical protein